jgi:hypothetical protein
MTERLVDVFEVIDLAAELRKVRLAYPDQHPDEDTEDDVISALRIEGYSPREIRRDEARLTKVLRFMIRSLVD